MELSIEPFNQILPVEQLILKKIFGTFETQDLNILNKTIVKRVGERQKFKIDNKTYGTEFCGS